MFFISFGWFFMVFTFLINPLSTGSPKHGQDSWFFMVFGWFTCFSWLLVDFSWFSLSWQTLCRQVLHNLDRAQSEAAKTFRRGRLDEDELTARTYNLLSTSVPTTENTKRWAYNNQEIFLVYFWPYIMIICVLKWILHQKSHPGGWSPHPPYGQPDRNIFAIFLGVKNDFSCVKSISEHI